MNVETIVRAKASEALTAWAEIERLRTIVVQHRAAGETMLAMDAARAIRPHHVALDRLTYELGLARFTRHEDVAAFARHLLTDATEGATETHG